MGDVGALRLELSARAILLQQCGRGSDSIRHAFTSFFQYGTFDKFPKFKLVLLEAGASWIAYWLDRLDAVFHSGIGRTLSR